MLQHLKIWLRKRLKPQTISIWGVTVATDLGTVTKDIRKALYREDYEASEARLVRDHLRADDRVLEVGGGVGLISLLCAKTCGAENLSIFEPNPTAATAIESNFALNGMTPDITQAAMALEDGEIEFFMNDNIFSSSLIDRKNDAKPVAVTTRDIRAAIADKKPTVLVMDIEGAEIDVLPHSAAPSVRAMIVELHPHIVGQEAVDGLIETMAAAGYPVSIRADDKVVMFERKAA